MSNIPEHDARAVAVVAAIRTGDVGTLERQLRDNPELARARIVDGRGVSRTLLHLVTDWPGHFPNGARTVGALVAAGAELNGPVLHADPHGCPETPLHWAASCDDVEVLVALLDGGADIEAPGAVFTGGTALSDAVVFAQWNAARELLRRGASMTIWQAAALGVLARVRELCAGSEPPGVESVTNALWHACRGGQRSTAECLLEQGADLNWVGYEDKTPLDVALESGAADLIQWLRERGALPAWKP